MAGDLSPCDVCIDDLIGVLIYKGDHDSVERNDVPDQPGESLVHLRDVQIGADDPAYFGQCFALTRFPDDLAVEIRTGDGSRDVSSNTLRQGYNAGGVGVFFLRAEVEAPDHLAPRDDGNSHEGNEPYLDRRCISGQLPGGCLQRLRITYQ